MVSSHIDSSTYTLINLYTINLATNNERGMVYAFEKLEVWQKSRLLVQVVYRVTKNFPTEERYGLTSQLRRAAVSVSSNIAEGSTRWGKRDKARFYEIAYGSLIEVMNQLILSADLGFMNEDELDVIKYQIAEISRMLDALYKSVNNS